MSDSVTKWHELNPEDRAPSKLPIKIDEKIALEIAETKLMDIDWSLKEYYGNMVDKDYLINKIDNILNKIQ